MREMSVAEQRYLAVLAVISDGETVTPFPARATCQSPVDDGTGGTASLR